MRYLLAAAAVLAVATPAAADHHMKGEHKGHHGDKHVMDSAMFTEHHGAALSAAINHPTRAEDRARDGHRHPAETLTFFHVGPHMKVGEYAPGGGWYSRLLGHYLGARGQLVGLYNNPVTATTDEERRARTRAAAEGFGTEVAGYTGVASDRVRGMTLETIPDEEKGTFDRILVIRSLHGITRGGIADTEIRAMRELLKDDGYLGVVQHRAKDDAPWSYSNGTNGYLREQDVIDFMRLNGFDLVAKSEINANPADTADHPRGVWEMPPVWATKREELKDKGESDRMTLLFRKRP